MTAATVTTPTPPASDPPDGSTGGRGLASRLMLAQALVLVAGFSTAGLVAAVVGPSIFHDHLIVAGHPDNAPEFPHVEEAFQDASLLSLGAASLIALSLALLVTWYISRRLQNPLTALTHAATDMGKGHYGARAVVAGAGPELSNLASAFNTMAGRLQETEETRRRLLSDLAHEMRTPVATISAYLDGLDDQVTRWDATTSQILRTQTDRLVRLCEDIDEVSRAEEGRVILRLSRMRVGDLIFQAADSARAAYAAKGVNLLADLDGGAGLIVSVDRQRLGQVLANLLDNALHHTPPGGTVRVAARAAGDHHQITVADTGEGIRLDQLPHLFERFYRADRSRHREHHGSGIGLTIAKALVDAHDGSLTASSAGPGRGAIFTISLPRG